MMAMMSNGGIGGGVSSAVARAIWPSSWEPPFSLVQYGWGLHRDKLALQRALDSRWRRRSVLLLQSNARRGQDQRWARIKNRDEMISEPPCVKTRLGRGGLTKPAPRDPSTFALYNPRHGDHTPAQSRSFVFSVQSPQLLDGTRKHARSGWKTSRFRRSENTRAGYYPAS